MINSYEVSKASIFTWLLSLSLVSIALSQSAPQKPLPTEPLEKYDNVPALLRRIELSPGMISRERAIHLCGPD